MVKPVIAIVDDDPMTRLVLESLLTNAGYTVHCWSSGAAAFEHLVQSPPDLIILDLILGDEPEGGWDALTLLRVEPSTAQVPVILISVNEEFLRQRETILRTKKHAIPLAKPFDVDDLLARIQQSLAQAR